MGTSLHLHTLELGKIEQLPVCLHGSLLVYREVDAATDLRRTVNLREEDNTPLSPLWNVRAICHLPMRKCAASYSVFPTSGE